MDNRKLYTFSNAPPSFWLIVMFFYISSCSMSLAATPLPEAELKNLLENKGGLDVSDYGQFGDLMLGERCELVLWIQ